MINEVSWIFQKISSLNLTVLNWSLIGRQIVRNDRCRYLIKCWISVPIIGPADSQSIPKLNSYPSRLCPVESHPSLRAWQKRMSFCWRSTACSQRTWRRRWSSDSSCNLLPPWFHWIKTILFKKREMLYLLWVLSHLASQSAEAVGSGHHSLVVCSGRWPKIPHQTIQAGLRRLLLESGRSAQGTLHQPENEKR